MPMFHRYHVVGPGWGSWLLASLITLAFWVLVITLIVMVVRSFRGHHDPLAPRPVPPGPPPVFHPGGPGAPETVLAERFARGDIDEAEYRARLAVLREPTVAPGLHQPDPHTPPPGGQPPTPPPPGV